MLTYKYRLKQMLKIGNGKDHSALQDGEYPVYGSGGLMRYADSYLYEGKSILLPRKGTLSNIQYVDGKFWTVDTCYYSIINENIAYPYYLYRLLKSCDLSGLDSGASIPSMTSKTYYSIKVDLPDIQTQKKIASVLLAYDNLIENNNKRIKILEQMAENLYKEWFVRFRFPNYQNTEFENGIPNGWRTVTLDSILSKIATGLNPRKNFVLGNGDNYYVTIKNMGDNNIYLDDRCDKVDDEAIIKINKRSDLRQGDLLFSGIGTIGRTYLINIPTNNWNISESVFTMRPKKIVSSEYLYMLLLSDDLQNYCQAKANGSAQKGIRMAVLRKYTFLLAPIAIIENFTKKARRILNLISLIREKNQNLTKQRDLLLPRLMSGKLEVK